MFDLNKRSILWLIVAPIQIKHIHSSVSYQQAIHQKYDRCGDELPSGYGPLCNMPYISSLEYHT